MSTKIWLFLGWLSLGVSGRAAENVLELHRPVELQRFEIAQLSGMLRDLVIAEPGRELFGHGGALWVLSSERKAQVYTLCIALGIVYVCFFRWYGCSLGIIEGRSPDAFLVALILIWLMVYREERRLRQQAAADFLEEQTSLYISAGLLTIRSVALVLCAHNEYVSRPIQDVDDGLALRIAIETLLNASIYNVVEQYPELLEDYFAGVISQVLRVVFIIVQNISTDMNGLDINQGLGDLFSYNRDVVILLCQSLRGLRGLFAHRDEIENILGDLRIYQVQLDLLARRSRSVVPLPDCAAPAA